MKVIYLSISRIPTEKAYGISTVKISEAFAEQGVNLELVIPRIRQKHSNIFDFYGVKNNFKITRIFCFDLTRVRKFEKFFYYLRFFSFSIFSCLYVFLKNLRNFDKIIFFSHDNIPLYFLSFFSNNIFYDIHDFPTNNFVNRRLMRKAFGFSVQTKWKIDELCEKFNVDKEKVVYFPNGTDFSMFKSGLSKEEARAIVGLPDDEKIVIYTGQLFSWKGVDTLIKSVDYLDEKTKIYLIGGLEDDVARLKKDIHQANDERIAFVPFQLHKDIPIWMRAADVLVLPNTAKEKISMFYTSPMKLFEYMLIGRPIVASAIPSIMEILNDNNSFLAEPDNPKSFADNIEKALIDSAQVKMLVKNAQEDVKFYSWDNRAKKIINAFEKHYR